MKLSVIIPCYNFSDYIEQSIRSVLDQITNFEFEILIGDDFSSDNSLEIIESIKSDKIKVFKNETNIGGHKNIINLFKNAKGEYISYIDGDDYFIDQYKLQKQVDFLDINKEYSLHSTGCYIHCDTIPYPHSIPLREELSIEDILENNLISFGRTFRNIPNLIKDWMLDMPYLDWCVNFELLKYGKAKCESWPSGCYRITGKGVITSDNEEDVILNNNNIKTQLNKEYEYFKKDNKTIIIIDCFVRNKNVEQCLIKCIDNFKSDGFDILLVSNTTISKNILEKVDYFIYDSRNQLFEYNYTNIKNVNLFKINEIFELHDIKSGLQKHGLSVLVNLFNSLDMVKNLGYTNFFRVEVDDLFGNISREYIKSVPRICNDQNKKALFYYNENRENEPNDISFHFMYSDIEFFLNKVESIRSEEEYKKFIFKQRGNFDFMIVEEYVYKNLKNNGDSEILIKDGTIMSNDFPDTIWNTIVSDSNSESKYKGITTTIYRKDESNHVIFTYSYLDKETIRVIEIIKDGSVLHSIEQRVFCNDGWSYNVINSNFDSIKVYENDLFLYEELNQNIENYIIFK
jgi:glycosyltransferase involved in cell wall biosynthesis